MLSFDDVGCDYGDRLKITCIDGKEYVGWFVDLEIDYDGSYGEDSVSLKMDDRGYVSFPEAEIVSMEPLTQRTLQARARYVGNRYKVTFEKGCEYELLEMTEDGFYKVYSPAVEDWALLPPQVLEIVWEGAKPCQLNLEQFG